MREIFHNMSYANCLYQGTGPSDPMDEWNPSLPLAHCHGGRGTISTPTHEATPVSKVTQLKRGRPAANLDTPTDLDDKTVRAISQALNAILADSFALYLKTKNFHWHMS